MAAVDFTTMTEVDANATILVVSSTKITTTLWERADESYVYKDMGAGNIGDFTGQIDWDAVGGGVTQQFGQMPIYGASDAVNDRSGWTDGFYFQVRCADTNNQILRIMTYDNTVIDTSINVSFTAKYVSLSRSSTTAIAEIYSESARTTLLDTITGTVSGNTLRYLYNLLGDTSLTTTGSYTSDIDNMDFTAVVVSEVETFPQDYMKFRKTLSGIGTGIGKRQLVGV